jgi:hypothetical protein
VKEAAPQSGLKLEERRQKQRKKHGRGHGVSVYYIYE